MFSFFTRRTRRPHAGVHCANPVAGPSVEGARLNVGCGFDYREGYVNVDLHAEHGPDLVCDATWLRPIADNACVEVLAQDVLEHIHRARCSTALLEWNRVLAVNGALTVRVPSLVHLLRLLSRTDRQSVEAQQRLVQCIYGTQGYEGDFHYNGFTEVTLRNSLEEAGFAVNSLRVVDEWLFEALAVKRVHKAPAEILRISSDVDFIQQAYVNLFNRAADPEGSEHYLKLLGTGIPREAILESLRASDEYRHIA